MTGLQKCVAVGLLLVWHHPAQAQSYPERPIRLVVPSTAGSEIDTIGRALAQEMSSRLKQDVVVDDRPGAGGMTAATLVAKSEPDGYTLLLATSNALSIAPALNKTIAYNPVTSVKPISGLTESPAVLVVNPSITVRSCPELVDRAKVNPGKIYYASPGIGTLPHLNGELFRMRAGIDIVHVPFRNNSDADASVTAGQSGMIFQSLGLVLDLVTTSKLLALGIASEQRNSRLPSVPTMIECGYPGFISSSWTAMLAPAGTLESTVALLNATLNTGLNTAQTRETLAKLALDPLGGSSQQISSRIATEFERWSETVRMSHIEIQ